MAMIPRHSRAEREEHLLLIQQNWFTLGSHGHCSQCERSLKPSGLTLNGQDLSIPSAFHS